VTIRKKNKVRRKDLLTGRGKEKRDIRLVENWEPYGSSNGAPGVATWGTQRRHVIGEKRGVATWPWDKLEDSMYKKTQINTAHRD